MQYQPRYIQLYMSHVYVHMPHLDLLSIDQNLFKIPVENITCDTSQNIQITSSYKQILRNVPWQSYLISFLF